MKIEGGEDANNGPLACDINVPFNFHLGQACQKNMGPLTTSNLYNIESVSI